MKLIDLTPKWLEFEGRRCGITFKCPHCQSVWLTCFTEEMPIYRDADFDGDHDQNTEGRSQAALWRKAVGEFERRITMVPCRKNIAWIATPTIEDATFENLSFSPSIDASASGHWHGFVSKGEVN